MHGNGHENEHGHDGHGHGHEHGSGISFGLQNLVSQIKEKLTKVAIFITPAPNIEGIDREAQERNWVKLMRLRVREKLGMELSFSESKQLRLSDGQNFICVTKALPDVGEIIDVDVRDLVRAINEKPYLMSQEACSGHIKGYDNPWLDDYGRMTFYIDPSNPKSLALIEELGRLCSKENERNPECLFQVKPEERLKGRHPAYVLKWRFNDPVYRRADQSLESGDWEGFNKLRPYMEQALKQATERGVDILGLYKDFMKKTADLIRSYR